VGSEFAELWEKASRIWEKFYGSGKTFCDESVAITRNVSPIIGDDRETAAGESGG